jgi:predicted nucleic acid-binding protein
VPAEIFVDTSAWYALAVPSVAEHAAVQRVLRDRIIKKVRVVTTNLVVAETHVLLLRRSGRRAAMTFLREVVRAPNVVVTSLPEHEAIALEKWLAKFEEHQFSLADAVSFAVMTERGIREALALDHHFAVAGFTVLPQLP